MVKTSRFLFFLLLVYALFHLHQGFAQSEGYSSTLRSVGPVWNNATAAAHMNELTNRFRNWDGKPIKVSDIRGSMYFDENFEQGKVFLGGQYYGSYLMRYNAYADEIEAKRSRQHDPEVISKSTRLSFVIGNEKYVLKRFLDADKNLVEGYLSELVFGNAYSLYHRKVKYFKEGKKPETSFHQPVPPQFLDSNTYYIVVEGKNPKRFKKTKKSLMKHIPKQNQALVRKFVKDNAIDFKEINDLIKLVAFMNTLN